MGYLSDTIFVLRINGTTQIESIDSTHI